MLIMSQRNIQRHTMHQRCHKAICNCHKVSGLIAGLVLKNPVTRTHTQNQQYLSTFLYENGPDDKIKAWIFCVLPKPA